MASLILKTRGLSQEQISLGGLIYSPKPEQRVSVIPLLKDRTDVDPVIWLIQLSRDPEEMVRISAIEALAKHKSPTVQRRLAEMARTDGSEAVRQAAGKVVPSCAGDHGRAAPPTRLVKPQSQGKLIRQASATVRTGPSFQTEADLRVPRRPRTLSGNMAAWSSEPSRKNGIGRYSVSRARCGWARTSSSRGDETQRLLSSSVLGMTTTRASAGSMRQQVSSAASMTSRSVGRVSGSAIVAGNTRSVY